MIATMLLLSGNSTQPPSCLLSQHTALSAICQELSLLRPATYHGAGSPGFDHKAKNQAGYHFEYVQSSRRVGVSFAITEGIYI